MKNISLIAALLILSIQPASAGKKFRLVPVNPSYNYRENYQKSYDNVMALLPWLEGSVLRDEVWDVLYRVKEDGCLEGGNDRKRVSCVRRLKNIEKPVLKNCISNTCLNRLQELKERS